MTKKDYEKAAKIVRDSYTRTRLARQGVHEGTCMLQGFLRLFEGEPRFNKERFINACDPHGEGSKAWADDKAYID